LLCPEMVIVFLGVTWQSWYLRGSLFLPRPVASALVKVHSASGRMTGSLPGSCASRKHPVRFYLEAGGQKTADNLLSAGEHTRILTSLPASLVCLSGCSPPSVNSQSGCYPLMRREVYPNPARLARDSSTNLRTLASF